MIPKFCYVWLEYSLSIYYKTMYVLRVLGAYIRRPRGDVVAGLKKYCKRQGLDTVINLITVSSKPYGTFLSSQDYVIITFENEPLDEDTVRHGLDLLFLLNEVFKNITTECQCDGLVYGHFKQC